MLQRRSEALVGEGGGHVAVRDHGLARGQQGLDLALEVVPAIGGEEVGQDPLSEHLCVGQRRPDQLAYRAGRGLAGLVGTQRGAEQADLGGTAGAVESFDRNEHAIG